MKDHEIRELVNQIRDIAIEYLGTQQLRERTAHVIRAAMPQSGVSPAHSDCCPEQSGVSPEQDQGWIPVSERMPEMGEQQCYVLAADFKNHYWPNIPNTQVGVYGDWFDDGNPTWDDGDGEDLHLKEVTHWMPLPAAPQEVRDE